MLGVPKVSREKNAEAKSSEQRNRLIPEWLDVDREVVLGVKGVMFGWWKERVGQSDVRRMSEQFYTQTMPHRIYV